MEPNDTEFNARDARSVLQGVNWRIAAALLTVLGVVYMKAEFFRFHAPFRALLPEGWKSAILLFLLSVFLLGQAFFTFGSGVWLKKRRWLNGLTFVCDLLILFCFCVEFFPISIFFEGFPKGSFFWILIWISLTITTFCRLAFYGLLTRKINTGRVACVIFGSALVPLLFSVMVWCINFSPIGMPAWIRNVEFTFLACACVAVLSFLCMILQFRMKLNQLVRSEPETVPPRVWPRVFRNILILILLFGAFFAYSRFWMHQRDRIYEDRIYKETPVEIRDK